MAYTLSADAIKEKNKLNSDSPFITLIDLKYDDSNYIYMTNYPCIYKYWKQYNDTYEGDRSKLIYPYPSGSEYFYFPFEFDIYQEDESGAISDVHLLFDNTNRFLEYYLHNYDLTDRDIILRILSINLLDDINSQLTNTFTIKNISSGSVVNITLGHPSVISSSIGHRMSSNHCIYTFKGDQCQYVGVGTTCLKYLGDEVTPNTCRYYNNSEHFGGCPTSRIK